MSVCTYAVCSCWRVGGRVFTDVAASGCVDVFGVLTPLTQTVPVGANTKEKEN